MTGNDLAASFRPGVKILWRISWVTVAPSCCSMGINPDEVLQFEVDPEPDSYPASVRGFWICIAQPLPLVLTPRLMLMRQTRAYAYISRRRSIGRATAV